jgi:AraC-like DNA-binding protein
VHQSQTLVVKTAEDYALARQALLAATHGSTTVSAVALDWGFWHFGEFSRAHKECFGELPSDTLRRKPSS